VGSYENDHEISGFIKSKEFIDKLSDY